MIPLAYKDAWNAGVPAGDAEYAKFVANPELPVAADRALQGRVPEPRGAGASGKPRADLEAVLLTGLPAGIVPGFQNNTGSTLADQLRLNMAIPPPKKPNPRGLASAATPPASERPPAGRRRRDDRPACGRRSTYPLIDKSYKPDAAVSLVSTASPAQQPLPVGLPLPRHRRYDGYDTPSS